MKTTFLANGNIVEKITSQYELVELWEFFLSGLDMINNPLRAKVQETPKSFHKVLVNTIAAGEESGVFLIKSKNKKPLGFFVLYDNSKRFSSTKTLFVYALYSNRKCPTTVEDALEFGEKFARSHGYNELQAISSRFSGAAFRWFEIKLGFERQFLSFRKQL